MGISSESTRWMARKWLGRKVSKIGRGVQPSSAAATFIGQMSTMESLRLATLEEAALYTDLSLWLHCGRCGRR